MATPGEIKRTYDGSLWYLDETLKVTKVHAEAQDLAKEHPTDVGWPVTLIGRAENRIEDIVGEIGYFNTGLRVIPPAQHHIEIVARNNLHKTGYELPSSPLVINPTFGGEILVPLRKFKEADDLELPYQAVEIILRPTVHAYLQGPKVKAPAARRQPQVDEDDAPVYKQNGKRGNGKGNHMF